jgi:hypothetical protein
MSYLDEINNQSQNLSTEPFPVSPIISKEIIDEIGAIESEELGAGIVVFRNAFNMDQSLVLDYIDQNAAEAHKTRWNYITGEDGVEYGINEDGFRYKLEEIPGTPVRLLQPVNPNTPKEVKEFFIYLEEQIYKSLLKYIDYYPLMLGSIWWKTRGHILRYGDNGILGTHADNDTNYKVTNGIRYMPRGMVASRQTCGALIYLNDCVETEEKLNGRNFTGGALQFVHLGIKYKPRRGDIIFFPTNYVASHNVERMGKGVRYSYLTFFGQGADDVPANIRIAEPEASFEWCPPVWLNNIYDDYEMYCKSPHSRYDDANSTRLGVEPGWNPIYQGRNVAQYNQSHEAVELESIQGQSVESNQKEILANEDLPEGPCGTTPQKV